MAKINEKYKLPEWWIIEEINGLDPDGFNEKIKNGITEYLYEASEKAPQLVRNWKTFSKPQLEDLLTSLGISAASNPEHEPDDLETQTITLDDYVVNFLKVYACIRKITPSQALIKFHNYDATFTARHGCTKTEIDP